MHPARALAFLPAFSSALALVAACPAQAVPGGSLGTLALGRYVCELPDTTDVTRGREMEGLEFSIVTTSSYRSHGTIGSYLRTGDSVVLTSGPRKGERFKAVSDGYLQKLNPDGSENPLRCVRTRRNNDPSRVCPEPGGQGGETPAATALVPSRDKARAC